MRFRFDSVALLISPRQTYGCAGSKQRVFALRSKPWHIHFPTVLASRARLLAGGGGRARRRSGGGGGGREGACERGVGERAASDGASVARVRRGGARCGATGATRSDGDKAMTTRGAMSGEAQTAAQRAGDGLMSSRVRRAGAKRIQSLGEPAWLMSCPGAPEGQFSRLYTLTLGP